MSKRDKLEMEKANALKVARAAIRLRHSVAADNEINDVVYDIEEDIIELQKQGRGWELDSKALAILPGPYGVKA